MLKKSLIMLKKCTYNSQSIAHYAQVEPTIMLTKTDMRHNIRPLQINSLFLIPPEPKNWCGRAAGNGRLITSLMGNGRLNHKFGSPKNWSGILLYCAGADGNTCGRKSRGDEKQLIDLEWPNETQLHYLECNHFSFAMCSDSKMGSSWLINPLPVHNM